MVLVTKLVILQAAAWKISANPEEDRRSGRDEALKEKDEEWCAKIQVGIAESDSIRKIYDESCVVQHTAGEDDRPSSDEAADRRDLELDQVRVHQRSHHSDSEGVHNHLVGVVEVSEAERHGQDDRAAVEARRGVRLPPLEGDLALNV